LDSQKQRCDQNCDQVRKKVTNRNQKQNAKMLGEARSSGQALQKSKYATIY